MGDRIDLLGETPVIEFEQRLVTGIGRTGHGVSDDCHPQPEVDARHYARKDADVRLGAGHDKTGDLVIAYPTQERRIGEGRIDVLVDKNGRRDKAGQSGHQLQHAVVDTSAGYIVPAFKVALPHPCPLQRICGRDEPRKGGPFDIPASNALYDWHNSLCPHRPPRASRHEQTLHVDTQVRGVRTQWAEV